MPDKTPQSGTSGSGPPRVTVVDDDPSFLRSVGRLLRSAGYLVETFGSPRQFLSALPGWVPQCLVLDVHMPEMTGLELYERLSACGHCVPVIFVTAYDTPQTREQARRSGSAGLLLKPFDKEALLRRIGQATSGRATKSGGPEEEPAQTGE
jgi:FixJ family two-component response regulator